MTYLLFGLVCVVAHLVAGALLDTRPFALAVYGNTVLIASAALVIGVIVRRRREWRGAQRLFWDTVALGMVSWIIGHSGWTYDELVLGRPSWLRWHTLFSVCSGIAPLIALRARPHRGPRPGSVPAAALDIAGYALFAVFIYSYFVLIPSLSPGSSGEAQSRLIALVLLNRTVLLFGLFGVLWFAWRTDWRDVYVRMALGVALGIVLRAATGAAIEQGAYRTGGVLDLAWIVPWLCYAWAAAQTPASQRERRRTDDALDPWPAWLLAAPALIVPLVGYGVLNVRPAGEPVDSFRLFVTSLTTVIALGILTLRLAVQGGALQRSDARSRLLVAATEQTGDLILITQPDGTFEHANAAYMRAFGYSRDELAALNFVDLTGAGAEEARRNIPAEIKARGIWRGTLNARRKDGTTFPAASTVTALRDPSGVFTHFVGVMRDMTEELKLRDQLVQSERLSAIGELVAGVAHEINNPLQTIIGNAELMLDETARPDRIELELVRKEAMRAGQIVRNLLSFVRRGGAERVPVDINQLAQATADLRDYHLRQVNISLQLRLAPRPLLVIGNAEELRQVVLNLLLNAEDAIGSTGGAGTVVIETANSGGWQTLDVVDSGPGVRPEHRGRIFEPFFTTREVGEGTGLGLSISHGIAVSHDGSLALVGDGPGARLRLTLPAYVDEAAGRVTDDPNYVLVVDDDPGIRRLLARVLERRGFEVSEADTAESALALVDARRPSVVICDVRLPGMTGLELVRRLSADGGQTPRFVLISGDTGAFEGQDGTLPGVPVLVKPFTATDLEAALAGTGMSARSERM